MRGYERGFTHSRPLISSHLISATDPSTPAGAPPDGRSRPRLHLRLHLRLYTSSRTDVKTAVTYLPTYPRTHDRAGRAQEFPNDDAVKPASARNEGAHAQKERLGAPESSGRQSFLAS
jgi:hypothetical protein